MEYLLRESLLKYWRH